MAETDVADPVDLDELAILEWVNTFSIPQKCDRLEELIDGNVFMAVLSEIAPEHFEIETLNPDTNGNWMRCQNNLKTLLRLIDHFFKLTLKKNIDMSHVDVAAIAKSTDVDALLNLTELIAYATSNCSDADRKATFLNRALALNDHTKAMLNSMSEEVGRRAVDADDEASEELIRAKEMVRHMKEERVQLEDIAEEQTKASDALREQVKKLQIELEVQATEGGAASNAAEMEKAEKALRSLRMELDDALRKLDQRDALISNLETDLKTSQELSMRLREVQAKLEAERKVLIDDRDLKLTFQKKLEQAEADVQKLKSKLEHVPALQKQFNEQERELSRYFNEIEDLKEKLAIKEQLAKQLEDYRTKYLKLDNDLVTMRSEANVREENLQQVLARLEEAQVQRQSLEDELQSARSDIQKLNEENQAARGEGWQQQQQQGLGEDRNEDGFGADTYNALREKLRRAEREISVLKASGGGSDAGRQQLQEELSSLRSELADERRAREDLKKQLLEAQTELHKASRARQELEQQVAQNGGPEHKAAAASLQEVERKLATAVGANQELTEKLSQQETLIGTLELQKARLESYCNRTMINFKEKYMAALQGIKEEKRMLEEQLAEAKQVIVSNLQTHGREERLMSSCLFEVGLRIMERKLASQANDPHAVPPSTSAVVAHTPGSGQRTALGVQRARLDAFHLEGIASPVQAAATEATLGLMSPSKTPSKLA